MTFSATGTDASPLFGLTRDAATLDLKNKKADLREQTGLVIWN
jgi:hypothetical protein